MRKRAEKWEKERKKESHKWKTSLNDVLCFENSIYQALFMGLLQNFSARMKDHTTSKLSIHRRVIFQIHKEIFGNVPWEAAETILLRRRDEMRRMGRRRYMHISLHSPHPASHTPT
jgi:hypothetical protein